MLNNSIAIIVQAIGVLIAPANTATKHIPINDAVGNGNSKLIVLPSVAPIKNSGVTSPPLKPAPIVTTVNMIFMAKSYIVICTSKD